MQAHMDLYFYILFNYIYTCQFCWTCSSWYLSGTLMNCLTSVRKFYNFCWIGKSEVEFFISLGKRIHKIRSVLYVSIIVWQQLYEFYIISSDEMVSCLHAPVSTLLNCLWLQNLLDDIVVVSCFPNQAGQGSYRLASKFIHNIQLLLHMVAVNLIWF